MAFWTPKRAAGPGLAFAAALLGLAAGGAGDTGVDPILRSGYVEVERVRVVLLPAKVEDGYGRFVVGLKAKDFKLTEDRVPQKITSLTVETDHPISVAFMLDVSGSMRMVGKLDGAKEAIRYFVDSLRPQDRFALICFADEQVAWVTEFTTDRSRFLDRLDVQRGYGQTALHDAVALAPGLVEATTEGKKAIVLITDGVDNASKLTLDQAIDLARRSSVPIYTVGFSSLPAGLLSKQAEVQTNFGVIERFSRETGGAMFAVHDPDELKEAIVTIDQELRYQYVIGYTPGRTRWDGGFRQVELTTRSKRFTVRTRTGYYATP